MDKYIVGLFDDEEVLIDAVKDVRKRGLDIDDCLTPFPVHGLDEAMGLKESRLHIVGFWAGAIGLTLALTYITYITAFDYPTNFGGKPFWSFPAFVPITFEFTVLSASVTMVVAFFIRNGLSVFTTPKIYDERITDDMFAMTFAVNENTTQEHCDKITSALEANGVAEIKIKDFDEEEY